MTTTCAIPNSKACVATKSPARCLSGRHVADTHKRAALRANAPRQGLFPETRIHQGRLVQVLRIHRRLYLALPKRPAAVAQPHAEWHYWRKFFPKKQRALARLGQARRYFFRLKQRQLALDCGQRSQHLAVRSAARLHRDQSMELTRRAP